MLPVFAPDTGSVGMQHASDRKTRQEQQRTDEEGRTRHDTRQTDQARKGQ